MNLNVMETKFYNIFYTGIKPCPGSSVKLEQNDIMQKQDNLFHKMEFQKMEWNMVMEYSYVRSM